MLSNAVASLYAFISRDNSETKSVPAFPPWELQTGFLSSLLLLHTPCPPAMIESPHQYLPIQNCMQSRCRIAGDCQVSRIVGTHLCFLFIPIFSINNLPHIKLNLQNHQKTLYHYHLPDITIFHHFDVSTYLKPLFSVLPSVLLLMKAFGAEMSSYNLFLCYI